MESLDSARCSRPGALAKARAARAEMSSTMKATTGELWSLEKDAVWAPSEPENSNEY